MHRFRAGDGVAEIVACANQKGGVGKTTTVVNLAAYLALEGRRVLVLDLDPQANATSGLGIDKNAVARSLYHALIEELPLADLVTSTSVPGLDLVPASRSLAGVEVELVPADQRERRLAKALAPLSASYDDILLDCPPSLGLLTVNGLTASHSVLVPIQCEYYALEGLGQVTATVRLVRDHLNPELKIKGILLTMFDARTTLSADVSAEVRRHLGDLVFEAVIPRNVRLAEAPSYGRPICFYDPGSRGADAYRAVAAEFVRRNHAGGDALPAAALGVPA